MMHTLIAHVGSVVDIIHIGVVLSFIVVIINNRILSHDMTYNLRMSKDIFVYYYYLLWLQYMRERAFNVFGNIRVTRARVDKYSNVCER